MRPGGKWIEGIRPEGSVSEAARLSLSARLSAVGHWLPLAATTADQDVEYVHQLRVSTRRSVAALELYRDQIGARKYRWLKKGLKKIRRAAGDARDLDVMTARLESELDSEVGRSILRQLGDLRADAQEPIVEIANRMRAKERFARKVHALLDDLRPRSKQVKRRSAESHFRSWARRELTETTDTFFGAIPKDRTDVEALHDFRIRAKALRYRIELLAPAFGPELRNKHYKVVEQLQERLGKMNDRVVGARRLRELSDLVATDEEAALLDTLAEGEAAMVAGEIRAFWKWWKPKLIDSLHRRLLA